MTHRFKATVHRVVQGVGFRPFIYNLAREKGLCGYVSNTSEGVDIEVEGKPEQTNRFFKEIKAAALPLARIRTIQKTPLNPLDYQNFAIRKSISLHCWTMLNYRRVDVEVRQPGRVHSMHH